VTAPVLLVQGTTDTQVDVLDAQLLAAARPDALLRIEDGMAHVLKSATLDAASQRAAYTDPSLPLVPDVVDTVACFALSLMRASGASSTGGQTPLAGMWPRRPPCG
jgi:hypothetical protein